jgi:hypothetical protein
VLPETQSPSISCNLDEDQPDNRSISTEGDTEPRFAVDNEGTEIHMNTEDLDLEKEIMNLGGTISERPIFITVTKLLPSVLQLNSGSRAGPMGGARGAMPEGPSRGGAQAQVCEPPSPIVYLLGLMSLSKKY